MVITNLTWTDVCQNLVASVRSVREGFKNLYEMGTIKFHRFYRLGDVLKHTHPAMNQSVQHLAKPHHSSDSKESCRLVTGRFNKAMLASPIPNIS